LADGVQVTVADIDLTDCGIVAICVRGAHRQPIPLPRTLLDPKIAGQYCTDGQVSMSTIREHVILDLTSEDEAGEWVEDAEDSLSAIVGGRAELEPPAARTACRGHDRRPAGRPGTTACDRPAKAP
jgi:hypothetical protein